MTKLDLPKWITERDVAVVQAMTFNPQISIIDSAGYVAGYREVIEREIKEATRIKLLGELAIHLGASGRVCPTDVLDLLWSMKL